MDNVTGLQKGSDVLLNGIPVGEVSRMDMLDNSKIAVTVSLNRDIKVPLGSAFVLQTSLIGASKLILERSNSSIVATKADTLPGSFDTASSMNLFLDSTKNKRVRKAFKKIIEGFQELLDSTYVDSTGN